MKLRKKLMLLEDFDAQSNAKVNTEVKAEVKTETKTGEAIRTEVIADVDAILTNLETLSAQMSEGNVTLNESFEDIMKSIMSTVNYGKAVSKLKDFGELTKAADQNIINGEIYSKTKKLQVEKEKLGEQKVNANGPAKAKIQAKLDKIAAKEESISLYNEKTKAKADDDLAAFTKKLDSISSTITGKLKDLFDAQKSKVASDVKQEGLEVKVQMAIDAGNKKRAEDAKTEAIALKGKQDAIAKKIADGEDQSSEDIAELKGMKPFMKEIEAFTQTRDASKKIEDQIDKAGAEYKLSESIGINHVYRFLIESKILSLFTAAKGDDDKEAAKKNLDASKKLAAAVKKASADEWKAKKALHDKVAAAEKVTTKSLITLAGGDAEAATEVDGGYKLGALIPKWGGEEGFISAEEFGPIKKATEVENGVDQAIEDLENRGTDEAKSVEDVAKETIGEETYDSFKKIPAGTENDKHPAKTDAEGNEIPGKDKWIEKQGPFKAKNAEGEDEGEEVYFGKEQSNESVEIEDVNEGINPKIKKAIKAVEKGETVYGENIRFPGRFKILSFNKSGNMATVDYEDGTDTMEMAAMNIAIDKLQFESVEIEEIEEGNEFGAARAEAIAKGEKTFKVGDEEYPVEDVSKEDEENAEEFVEEAKEELPKTIKLDEGLTIAQRFSRLM